MIGVQTSKDFPSSDDDKKVVLDGVNEESSIKKNHPYKPVPQMAEIMKNPSLLSNSLLRMRNNKI